MPTDRKRRRRRSHIRLITRSLTPPKSGKRRRREPKLLRWCELSVVGRWHGVGTGGKNGAPKKKRKRNGELGFSICAQQFSSKTKMRRREIADKKTPGKLPLLRVPTPNAVHGGKILACEICLSHYLEYRIEMYCTSSQIYRIDLVLGKFKSREKGRLGKRKFPYLRSFSTPSFSPCLSLLPRCC